MMEGFRTYLESEESDNVKKLIAKLPKKHQKLLHGYKFKYTPGNTLDGDDQHIGYIHRDKIVVAAPWRYSREFTTLHEIGHLVFEKLMTPKLRKQWGEIAKKNPRQNQDNAEENFSMAYAATYSQHPPTTHFHSSWVKFIKELVPS